MIFCNWRCTLYIRAESVCCARSLNAQTIGWGSKQERCIWCPGGEAFSVGVRACSQQRPRRAVKRRRPKDRPPKLKCVNTGCMLSLGARGPLSRPSSGLILRVRLWRLGPRSVLPVSSHCFSIASVHDPAMVDKFQGRTGPNPITKPSATLHTRWRISAMTSMAFIVFSLSFGGRTCPPTPGGCREASRHALPPTQRRNSAFVPRLAHRRADRFRCVMEMVPI